MKVRNVSGERLAVPELNRVVDVDEVVEVPDERADGYISQPHWRAESKGGKR